MTDLFATGTPEAPGAALALFHGAGEHVRWHLDPANVGLLSRALREGGHAVTVVLPAEDLSTEQTRIACEKELQPTLRRLRGQVPIELSTGRPYFFPPPALDISTNDLCGLECNMCGNRAKARDPETMLPDQVRALIADAADWGIGRVALTGAGEPFRDPNMLDHLRHANALGLLVTITTNGFPISEKIAAELARSTISVSVSIHGATDETHDEIVGVPKAAANAWRAIQRMVAAREPGSKLSINVSTVIQRRNLQEIPALVRRAHAAGIDGINIQPVNLQHGSFRGDGIVRRDDLVLMGKLWPARKEHAELDAMFDELDRVKAELGKFVHPTPERLALLRRYFRDSSRDALGVACRVGEAFLAIDHRGQIKPCYRLPWSHGDARLKNLRALWNSQAYARTRALVDTCPLTCLNNCFFRDKRVAA